MEAVRLHSLFSASARPVQGPACVERLAALAIGSQQLHNFFMTACQNPS